MEPTTELETKSSSRKTDEERKNNLKKKYSKKSRKNVLDGSKIKIVRYKEEDKLKLKEKYSIKKSNTHVPFDKDFLDSIIENKNKTEEVETTEEIISPKVNVFQFMMNSRHKVIGSNSPGKEKKPEVEKSFEEISEKKEKKKKQKASLGEWAEKKGGQKRKLADEAQEEYIKETMRERSKRLKKMLEIIDEDLMSSSHDDSDHEIKSTKKIENKKSSETNIDIKIQKSPESDTNKVNESDEKTKISKSKTEKYEEKEKTKTLKCKTQKTEDQIEIEHSENLKKTPIGRPKRNLKSNSVKLEEIEKEIKSIESEKQTPKHKVRRKQNNDSDKIQLDLPAENNQMQSENDKNNHDLIENQNAEKETEIEDRSNVGDNNFNNIEKNENIDHNLAENISEISAENKINSSKKIKKLLGNLSLKKNKKSNTPEAKKQTEKETESLQTIESTKNDDSNESTFSVNTPTTNKKTRQLKLFQDSNSKQIEEENKSFTPKTWKMKVRLFEKENIDEEIADKDKSFIIINDEDSPKKSQIQGKISNFFSIPTSSDSSISFENKKNVKLAPLFLKQQSKKQTKADIEAKKKFLLSGMPEQVKKATNKQQSTNELKLQLFPKISHVQQIPSNNGIFDVIWDLPNISLILVEKQLENITKITYDTLAYGTLTDCVNTEILQKRVCSPPTKIPNLKEYVTLLKKEYPDYPIFKTFRLLYEKHTKHINKLESTQTISTSTIESAKKRRGRSKIQKSPSNAATETQKDSYCESQMWTEKYKPLCQDDIIGNYSSVKQLKSWLQSWLHYSEDQKLLKKRKRANSSSDDFCNDSDSHDAGDALPHNMIILVGPFGTGKTASVYALCNELNINVIEINASSKRTGKRILTELQEATQSHQVKNTDSKSVNSFFKKNTEINTDAKEEENKKLSLLLMEDVDIVFDDLDDGFISSLTTLVISSKRPIILTTSDQNCLHLQKLFSQHDIIDFNSLTCRLVTPWLQILCLVEGIRTDKCMIDQLLEWNKGDIRKTMLQLQFWVQSGGDTKNLELENKKLKLTKDFLIKLDGDFGTNDESSNLSWLDSETSNSNAQNIHKSCVDCFTPFYEKDKISLQLSFPINLGNIWWNLPSILHINSVEHKEIFKTAEILSNSEKETDEQSDLECSGDSTKLFGETEISSSDNSLILFPAQSDINISDLKIAVNFLESLVFTDTMYTKLKTDNDYEPTYQFWQINPVNSLLLIENYEMYNETKKLSYEISQWLIENNIKKCKKFKGNEDLNVAVPCLKERRWRNKIHKSMEDVTDMIPPSCLLDRIGICEDYFPFLRNICRVENSRLANNNKRKNRFYHYFKTFNIHLSESTYLVLCNSLAYKI